MNTYCVRERKKTGNDEVTYVRANNGRIMMKSKCTSCGGRKSSFVKKMNGAGLDIHKTLTIVVGNRTLPFQKYQGEMHLKVTKGKTYSYCGPGTNLGTRLLNMTRDGTDSPINRLDRICLRRDLSYHNAGNDKKKKLIAHRAMVKSIDALKNKTPTEKLVRTLINKKANFGL